jgi:hypothetical protein
METKTREARVLGWQAYAASVRPGGLRLRDRPVTRRMLLKRQRQAGRIEQTCERGKDRGRQHGTMQLMQPTPAAKSIGQIGQIQERERRAIGYRLFVGAAGSMLAAPAKIRAGIVSRFDRPPRAPAFLQSLNLVPHSRLLCEELRVPLCILDH